MKKTSVIKRFFEDPTNFKFEMWVEDGAINLKVKETNPPKNKKTEKKNNKLSFIFLIPPYSISNVIKTLVA